MTTRDILTGIIIVLEFIADVYWGSAGVLRKMFGIYPEPEPYSSMTTYLYTVAVFFITMQLLPFLYVFFHKLWLLYLDYYIETRLGRLPSNHEERFKLYFELREHPISDWRVESRLTEQEADYYDWCLRQNFKSFVNNVQTGVYYKRFLKWYEEIFKPTLNDIVEISILIIKDIIKITKESNKQLRPTIIKLKELFWKWW
jgi:hypothetical protein